MINKKPALFFLCANAAFLLVKIGFFFYTGVRIFSDLNHPTEPLNKGPWLLWNTAIYILLISVYAGIYWIFKIFNEKVFIRIAVILFACFLSTMTCLSFLFQFKYIRFTMVYPSLIASFDVPIVIFFTIALIFVKNKIIKKYILLFDLSLVLLFVIPLAGPFLYEVFSENKWFLINRDFLTFFPYTVSLILFVEVYNLAGRGSANSNERSQFQEV